MDPIELVPMPVWYGMLKPVLEVMADGSTWKRRELFKAVCDHLGLTNEQRAERLSSGESRAENRIGWAVSALYKAELIEKPERGTYVLNFAGRQFLEQHPGEISEKTLKTVPVYQAYVSAIGADRPVSRTAGVEPAMDASADPLEMIENGVAALHGEVAADLLKRLREQDPSFLEQSVLDVLVAMGYGGTEQRATVLGGSGDSGVDGVIDQDPLGLERVYVQAKRSPARAVGRSPSRCGGRRAIRCRIASPGHKSATTTRARGPTRWGGRDRWSSTGRCSRTRNWAGCSMVAGRDRHSLSGCLRGASLFQGGRDWHWLSCRR